MAANMNDMCLLIGTGYHLDPATRALMVGDGRGRLDASFAIGAQHLRNLNAFAFGADHGNLIARLEVRQIGC